MSSRIDLTEILRVWADKARSISGLVLIGSQERATTEMLEHADVYSDWDFQIITSNVRMFADPEWIGSLPGVELRAYAARTAKIGAVPKINAVFSGAEMDIVIIPAHLARLMKMLVALGWHRREGRVRQRLQELALIIRPGWRFIKGGDRWGRLYRQIVAELPDPRITDESARRLANGLVCDYIWTLRKIGRGELLAAQRMLHRELAETNFQLLHELKQRRGEKSFHEARRIERIASSAELEDITVNTSLEAEALRFAAEKSVATCRGLMRGLMGELWKWPEVN